MKEKEWEALYMSRNNNTGCIETFGLLVHGNKTNATREAKLKAIQYDWRFLELRTKATKGE